MNGKFEVGDTVSVPWGLDSPKRAKIVEIWGDPPAHVRVKLDPFEGDDSDEPIVILISPSVLKVA